MMNDMLRLRISYLQELFQTLNIGEFIEIEEFKHRDLSKTSKFLIYTSKGKFLAKFYGNIEPPNFLNFLEFLNAKDFPTNVLISKENFVSVKRTPVLIYSYIEGRTKSFLNEDDLRETSQLIARLHSESDLFHGRSQLSQSGLTHGDVNITNIVCTENGKLFLIDFDKISYREYISDVASFLFFNSLSDLSHNSLDSKSIRYRGHYFVTHYENAREIKLNSEQISQALRYQSQQFLKHARQQFREKKVDDEVVKERETLSNIIVGLFH